jgi:hypothetical protein
MTVLKTILFSGNSAHPPASVLPLLQIFPAEHLLYSEPEHLYDESLLKLFLVFLPFVILRDRLPRTLGVVL